ncbi:hypothetical protein [Raoultibacter phocaeensis]|uniref:hypothetical protein n=1 Tax=Raoultibacter phocaeensis TaxID=2479841 RepID=UPI00111819F3|nr:hypothetical protein [Raoultibacter phocaeensis]
MDFFGSCRETEDPDGAFLSAFLDEPNRSRRSKLMLLKPGACKSEQRCCLVIGKRMRVPFPQNEQLEPIDYRAIRIAQGFLKRLLRLPLNPDSYLDTYIFESCVFQDDVGFLHFGFAHWHSECICFMRIRSEIPKLEARFPERFQLVYLTDRNETWIKCSEDRRVGLDGERFPHVRKKVPQIGFRNRAERTRSECDRRNIKVRGLVGESLHFGEYGIEVRALSRGWRVGKQGCIVPARFAYDERYADEQVA